MEIYDFPYKQHPKSKIATWYLVSPSTTLYSPEEMAAPRIQQRMHIMHARHPKLTVCEVDLDSIQELSYPQDVNFELWLPSGQLSAAVIHWQFLATLSLEKMAAPRTPYRDVVLTAFKNIPVDPDGLTRDTISEYIKSELNVEEDCDVKVKRALKALIEEGLVVQDSDTKRYQAVQTGPPVEASYIKAAEDTVGFYMESLSDVGFTMETERTRAQRRCKQRKKCQLQ